MSNSLNAYALNKFKFDGGKLPHITTEGGEQLSILEPMPGWGGFGNNKSGNNIVVDGREARFMDDHSAQAIGYRTIEFI